MRQALRYARHFDLPLIPARRGTRTLGRRASCTRDASRPGSASRGFPGAADDVMVSRDLLLVADTGGRYHLAHMSTARSLDLIRAARADGQRVTCEVSAHHLLLTDEDVFDSGLDPNFKMHPPLRSAADRDALVLGLADGSIDAIASDHAPHHPDEKELDFVASPNGIVGLETTLSLCLDRLVAKGVIDPGRAWSICCRRRRRGFLGVAGGSLAPGLGRRRDPDRPGARGSRSTRPPSGAGRGTRRSPAGSSAARRPARWSAVRLIELS